MAGGDWIKVHRSMLDTAIWADEWLVKLWIWCLLKANYAPRSWNGDIVDRGQFVTGRNTASDELGVSPSKWYRGIVRLAELGNVKIEANSKWTRITVCNYSRYQDSDRSERTADEQRLNSERTADEQQMNSQRTLEKKERSKEGKNNTNTCAAEQHAAPAAPRKSVREEYPADFERFWAAYRSVRKTAKGDALKAWKQVTRDADPEVIIAAAREYGESPMGTSEYGKLPASWLRQKCWDDDRQAWQGKRGADGLDIPF